MAAALGVAPEHFLTCYQIHSPEVVVAETPWPASDRPRADAIVTRVPGLAIGVSTADCGPVLLADPEARVIGAAHAGWRGALTGVIEATVAAMEKLGAERGRIVAAAGPMIRQPNYEVGQDLIDRFVAVEPNTVRFFKPASRPGHSMFDLAGYVVSQIAAGRDRGDRGPRPLHLCRSGAVLFLPPRHPSGRARLRPSYQRDRAGRLTTSGGPASGLSMAPKTGPADGPRPGIAVTNSLRKLAVWLTKMAASAGVR